MSKRIGRPRKYDLDYLLEDYEKGASRELITVKYRINRNTLKSRLCDYRKGRLKRQKRTIVIRLDDEVYQKVKHENVSSVINKALKSNYLQEKEA